MKNKPTTYDLRLTTTFWVLLLVVGCWLLVSATVLAAPTEYTLLEPLPLGENNEVKTSVNAGNYIPGLFRFAIALAGVLAVVRLIWAGIQYMSTDAFSGKSEAKNTIENALWGLLLAFSAYAIVFTIGGKRLTEFNLNITPLPISTTTFGGGGPAPIPGSCNNCRNMQAPQRSSGRVCNAPVCQLNADLDAKLVELNRLNGTLITEAYPPTRRHEDSCHNTGMCVDAKISSNTPQNIKKTIEDANRLGLYAIFEVLTGARKDELLRNGFPQSGATRILVNPAASGEHFHIKPLSGSSSGLNSELGFNAAASAGDCVGIWLPSVGCVPTKADGEGGGGGVPGIPGGGSNPSPGGGGDSSNATNECRTYYYNSIYYMERATASVINRARELQKTLSENVTEIIINVVVGSAGNDDEFIEYWQDFMGPSYNQWFAYLSAGRSQFDLLQRDDCDPFLEELLDERGISPTDILREILDSYRQNIS